MLKTFKWLWERGEAAILSNVILEIESRVQYHQQQAKIAFLEGQCGIKDDPNKNMFRSIRPRLTPKEHEVAAEVLLKLLERITEVGGDL